jgi:hypothetical protein|eukprot:SAG25_NODE_949_length_4609_cov_5.731264_6_plen_144_part_00
MRQWKIFGHELVLTAIVQASPSLTSPLENVRLGAQLSSAALISRAMPPDVVTLGKNRWLLAAIGTLQAGAKTRVVVGLCTEAHSVAELPQPTSILATFEAPGSLTGLQATAAVSYDVKAPLHVPLTQQFSAMPSWYRAEDGMN